jgi:hypothetical protein
LSIGWNGHGRSLITETTYPEGGDVHVLDHLTHEHREAERMLAQLSSTEAGPEEEMFVYPIALDVLDADDKEEVTEANNEHGLARDGLAQLHEFADEPGFGAVVDMLTAGIAHHVREEETELFPDLRSRAEDRLGVLDPQRCEQEVRLSGVGEGPTRDELYEQAQKADIPGRSQMSKQELAEALRDA